MGDSWVAVASTRCEKLWNSEVRKNFGPQSIMIGGVGPEIAGVLEEDDPELEKQREEAMCRLGPAFFKFRPVKLLQPD